MFVNPDLHADRVQSAARFSFTIQGLDLSTAIEQDVVDKFRSVNYLRIPESDFFLLQSSIISALLHYYKIEADIQFDPRKVELGTKNTKFDTPEINLKYYFKYFEKSGFAVYSLSPVAPDAIRALVKEGIPILMLGELYYNKAPGIVGDSIESLTDEERRGTGKTLFRRHESFDIIIGYARLHGPRSTLPGEEGYQYVYKTRTGFSFTSYDGNNLSSRAVNLYGIPNDSRWLPKKFFVIAPDSISEKSFSESLKAKTGVDFDLSRFSVH